MKSALFAIARFLGRVARRTTFGALLAVAIALAPLPSKEWPVAAALQTPIAAIVFVCSIGKALYDTLF